MACAIKVTGVTAQVVDFPDSASAHSFAAQSSRGGDLRTAAETTPGAPAVQDLSLRESAQSHTYHI